MLLTVTPLPPEYLPSNDHVTPVMWALAFGPVVILVAVTVFLVASGSAGGRRGLAGLLVRADSSLERLTGLPGWAASGISLGTFALALAAFVGFMWDVAWHADFGRDKQLFTIPHTMILEGLIWIGLAGFMSAAFATVTGANVGWRLGRLRVPHSSLPLMMLGVGAAIGFPLDDLWHATYGIDVTMWSPTHLLMISGASLSPIAYWLMLAEAGPRGDRPLFRYLRYFLAGALLVGLSTFQDEFDTGIPQWQMVFQPILIVAAGSIGLVVCRVVLGRGGAVIGALVFLLLRGLTTLLVSGVLGHAQQRFALYLGMAVLVEIVFLLESRLTPVRLALATGAVLGTAGLATEWGWSHVWNYHPWQLGMLPAIWPAVLVGMPGAVVGMAMGGVLSWRHLKLPAWIIAVSLAAVAILVALHLPLRTSEPVAAELKTHQVGGSVLKPDRDGFMKPEYNVDVDLSIDPADAADGADWFQVTSWEGGIVKHTNLVQVSPGHFRSERPVPVGGSWKSAAFLMKGDVFSALAIYMPADLTYKQAEIPAPADRKGSFLAAGKLLMSEAHGGAQWPSVLAYTAFALIVLLWCVLFLLAYGKVGAQHTPLEDTRRQLTSRPRLRRELS